MRLVDQARSVRHVFSRHRGRTALTLLGVIIGAGSIVLLASLLKGGEEALTETSQRASEADLVQIHSDEPPPQELRRTMRQLSHKDADALGGTPLLDGAGVASEQQYDAMVYWKTKKKNARMIAALPRALDLYRLEMQQGRFLTAEDLAERRRVCVVGHEIWRELLEESGNLNELSIKMAGELWFVVGVLKNKQPLGGGNGVWFWNSKVLVPQTTYDAIYNPQHNASRVYVRLRGLTHLIEKMAAVERVIKQTLLRRHYGVHNFKVEGEQGAANQMKLILMVIKMLLLGTALLSLLVGGINIMNIMLVTVTERTREIGIRRAVGASRGAILTQFLFESGSIALVGGIMGVVGGIGISWLLALLLGHLLGGWNFHIETWSVSLGLGLSLVTGLVFGLYPAWRAARLDPVEALHYE